MTPLLPVLPVAGPLMVAGLLLAVAHHIPPRLADVVAALVALASAAVCAVMAVQAQAGPLVLWFGGWAPGSGAGPGQVIGVGFAVDQAGGWIGAFTGLLFAATIVFAWGFFDGVHAHFHVLMLLFMAGITGFAMTHDLFNLFVWFELMSVAGFALTGYALRSSALGGALNFTVLNTIGAYLILGGIGLLYSRTGALDFAALSGGIAAAGPDPVVTAAFVLLATGLLVKAAQVPFHFWLADAHAVAPSPVSVIFSGVMVAIALFGIARLVFQVFWADADVHRLLGGVLLGFAAITVVLGGVMSLLQRHLKRLLAFSTIGHAGIMLLGICLLRPGGLAGMLVYLVGHGLVKGALFMVAGIFLATRASIDELELRGLGGGIWPAGIAMALGGLLLAGLPVGLMDRGTALIGAAIDGSGRSWLHAVIIAGSACTGAAVLRAAGRIFLGLGPDPGEDVDAPSEQEQEDASRPLWLMLAPAALLLLLAVAGLALPEDFPLQVARQILPAGAGLAADPPLGSWPAWLSVALALLIAAWELFRDRLPRAATVASDDVFRTLARGLRAVQSGLVGDYVTWLVVGLACFALALV